MATRVNNRLMVQTKSVFAKLVSKSRLLTCQYCKYKLRVHLKFYKMLYALFGKMYALKQFLDDGVNLVNVG